MKVFCLFVYISNNLQRIKLGAVTYADLFDKFNKFDKFDKFDKFNKFVKFDKFDNLMQKLMQQVL